MRPARSQYPNGYWDLAQVAEAGVLKTGGDELELIDSLDCLLQDAVGRRMAADVPLGVLDSLGIAAIASSGLTYNSV